MLNWVDKLGYNCIINKIMKVKFWGTRGSIPSPGKNTVKYGGNTTCVEVIPKNGKEIIIDAGSGIRLMVDKIISEGIKEISLLLTHSHWDHIQGFPFFTPIYNDNFSLNIYGVSPTFERLLDILKGQMDFIYWPVKFEHIDANVNFKKIDNSGISIDNVKINSIMTNHPLETHAFKFEESGKVFIFMTDNELDHPHTAKVPYKKHLEFVKDADVLVHDAQYKKEEMKKFKGWGHSSWQEVVSFAKKAGVKKLYLTHYDPDRNDLEVDKIIKEANKMAGDSLTVRGAIEGESFEI